MKIGLALSFSILVSLAHAENAVVTSGEHPGFTRLVIQYNGPADWQMGRTLDGYVVRVPSEKPVYDLGKTFDLIGKGRLAAIWTEPETGDLHFGIACACYAIPFEFRKGILVVDFHDGTPPKGSSFEQPLDHSQAPAPAPANTKTPIPSETVKLDSSYDWTTLALQNVNPSISLNSRDSGGQSNPLMTMDANLEPLRLSLIDQLGRGASQGIVDLTLSSKAKNGTDMPGDKSVMIHLGQTPDLIVRQKGQSRDAMTADGAKCVSDEQLDISIWGSSRPIADQIGPERQGLTGEFDKPDPDAVARAVRFQLFLGFGAEARSLMRAFPGNSPDQSIWESIARILDEENDPNPAFSGMEDCDTAAALWATLANPSARPTDEIGKAAILRHFSALPLHLRRLLGPRLVQRFLDAGDFSVATALRDSILRAPGDPGPGVILMQAAIDRAMGKPAKSESQLEPLATASGPASNEALVELVEQKALLGQTVAFSDVRALEEATKERRGSSEESRYVNALTLARAASGDFDKAFADATRGDDVSATLWHLLAQSGSDTALLAHATLDESLAPPRSAKKSAGIIADRMLNLGFTDQARRWLDIDDTAPQLLRARVDLAGGNPNSALDRLRSDNSPSALTVKAEAKLALNDEAGAADLYAQMGKSDAQWAAISLSHAWGTVARDGPDPWKAVAKVIAPPPVPDTGASQAAVTGATAQPGPLARGAALVSDSSTTRNAINSLLDAVKAPVQPTQ